MHLHMDVPVSFLCQVSRLINVIICLVTVCVARFSSRRHFHKFWNNHEVQIQAISHKQPLWHFSLCAWNLSFHLLKWAAMVYSSCTLSCLYHAEYREGLTQNWRPDKSYCHGFQHHGKLWKTKKMLVVNKSVQRQSKMLVDPLNPIAHEQKYLRFCMNGVL